MELMNKSPTGKSLKEQKPDNEMKMLQQELFASKEIIKKLKNDIKQLKKTESEEKKRFNQLVSENVQFKKQTDNYAMDHIEQKKLIRKLMAENKIRAENQPKSTEDLIAFNEKQPDGNDDLAVKLLEEKKTFEIHERELQNKLKIFENEIDLLKIENEKLSKSKQIQLDSFAEQVQELKNTNKSYEQKLSLKSIEINDLRKEFDCYKKRAQSILENQSMSDRCAEDKFREEIVFLKKELSICENQSTLNEETISTLNTEINQLSNTKNEQLIELKRLTIERDGFELENDQLKTELNNCKLELRQSNLKNAAVIDCYVQQVKELETKLNMTEKELKQVTPLLSVVSPSPLPSPSSSPSLSSSPSPLPSSNQSNGSNLLVTNTLISNDNNDHNITINDTKISPIEKEQYENRIVYLLNLLADTEQDLKKYIQMNKLLKDEIRKQEVSFEQNPSAENYAYLKHIIIKFLTLNNTDERLQLINVINTMLKLTNDEQKQLTEVVKGKNNWSSMIW